MIPGLITKDYDLVFVELHLVTGDILICKKLTNYITIEIYIYYSYVENTRTLACMSVCCVYQSHGHPVWVFGEDITSKDSSEHTAEWQFHITASKI